MTTTSTGSSEQEQEADDRALGFWLFLLGDLVVFSLLFATYVVSTRSAPSLTAADFSLLRVAQETAALLASSFAFGLGVEAARCQRFVLARALFAGAMGLALIFLALELAEFVALAAAGKTPATGAGVSAYYALIGAHGAHVASASVWLAVNLIRWRSGVWSAWAIENFARLGVLWHFLDLVWIGIFSVVYLPEFFP